MDLDPGVTGIVLIGLGGMLSFGAFLVRMRGGAFSEQALETKPVSPVAALLTILGGVAGLAGIVLFLTHLAW